MPGNNYSKDCTIHTQLTNRMLCRSIYEGPACEYMLEDFEVNEDTVHSFRVAAVNDIGRGPYNAPVNLTKTKACTYLLVEWFSQGFPYKKQQSFPVFFPFDL